MTLQWADFPSGQAGLYGNGESYALNGTPWVTMSTIVSDPDPNIPVGYVLRNGGNRLVLSDPDTKVGVAFRFWVSAMPSGNRPFLIFTTTTGVGQYAVATQSNGGVRFSKINSNGTEGTNIAVADFPVIFANSWNHVEVMLDTASGEFEFRLNGVARLTATDGDPDTRNVGSVNFASQFAGQGSNSAFHTKDIVLYNSQGSTFNTWQGSVSVYDVRPDADITLGGWTPSSGSTGFNLLNESPPDDGSYIQADDSPPAAAEMTFTNLPEDVTSVRAVMAIVRSLKTDGGDGNLQISISPDGTNYDNGNDNPITTAATYRWDISELSPATSSAWTPNEVDSIRMKFDRTV